MALFDDLFETFLAILFSIPLMLIVHAVTVAILPDYASDGILSFFIGLFEYVIIVAILYRIILLKGMRSNDQYQQPPQF